MCPRPGFPLPASRRARVSDTVPICHYSAGPERDANGADSDLTPSMTTVCPVAERQRDPRRGAPCRRHGARPDRDRRERPRARAMLGAPDRTIGMTLVLDTSFNGSTRSTTSPRARTRGRELAARPRPGPDPTEIFRSWFAVAPDHSDIASSAPSLAHLGRRHRPCARGASAGPR